MLSYDRGKRFKAYIRMEVMSMCRVVVDIPKAVLYDTRMNSSETAEFMRQRIALIYYTELGVSIGYCAQIAGMTEEEFIAFLGKHQIDIFHFENDEELLRDAENA